MAVVCNRWQIENGLHDRRDVTLDEDASLTCIGQAPHEIATVNIIVCLGRRHQPGRMATLVRSRR
jgi:predicted transposase YbfD/YdcC